MCHYLLINEDDVYDLLNIRCDRRRFVWPQRACKHTHYNEMGIYNDYVFIPVLYFAHYVAQWDWLYQTLLKFLNLRFFEIDESWPYLRWSIGTKQNHKTVKQNRKTQNKFTKLKTESQKPKQNRKIQNRITKLKTESQNPKTESQNWKKNHKTQSRITKLKTESQNPKTESKNSKQNHKTQNRITKLKTESQNSKRNTKLKTETQTQNRNTKLKTETQNQKRKYKTDNREKKTVTQNSGLARLLRQTRVITKAKPPAQCRTWLLW